MKLLVLGGTRFLGRHLVAAARARGHELTLFQRGTQPGPANPDVERIHGDRHRDLAKLGGRRWDAVIDTSGYLPDSVRASAEALASAVDRYVFISSVSVYAGDSGGCVDETAPLLELTSEELQRANAIDVSGQVSATTFGPLYGGLKALCEDAAERVLPGRVLSIRAGLIVGRHDYTDRFTYWVARAARGGDVLAPGRPGRHVQFLDARDLAEWIMEMIEARRAGTFNATGQPDTITMETLLEACRAVSGSDAKFHWVSEAFLRAERVRPWTEMPLWLPEGAVPSINPRKAVAAGLRFRPLHDTIRDVLTWYREEEQGRSLRAGITADREQELLRRR